MPDQPTRIDEKTLDELFPWLRLRRGVGVAIDAKKLILAVLGLLVFHARPVGTRPALPAARVGPLASLGDPAGGFPRGADVGIDGAVLDGGCATACCRPT